MATAETAVAAAQETTTKATRVAPAEAAAAIVGRTHNRNVNDTLKYTSGYKADGGGGGGGSSDVVRGDSGEGGHSSCSTNGDGTSVAPLPFHQHLQKRQWWQAQAHYHQ